MAIKLADTLAPMSEFPAAMAEHIGFSDGASLQEKFDNKELGGGDSSVTLTQEEYEALTEEERLNGLYYTYDTKRIYKNGVQYGASEPIPLTMEEYKTLKEAGAIDEQQEYLVEADAEGIFLGAEDIGYNNAESGIQATTVQGAIDKVAEKVGGLISDTDLTSATSTWSSSKIASEIEETIDFSTPILEYRATSSSSTDEYTYTTTQKTMFVCFVSGVSELPEEAKANSAYARVILTDYNIVTCSLYVEGDNSTGLGNSCILPKGTKVTINLKARNSQHPAVKAYAIN